MKTTVMDDAMQRAPAFVSTRARESRAFGEWLKENFDVDQGRPPRRPRSPAACGDIEQYSASRILYTRFNYTTGDAAGQNLSGKATAGRMRVDHVELRGHPGTSSWSRTSRPTRSRSQVNMLRTRGKRVVAEATIPNELIGQAHAHVVRA